MEDPSFDTRHLGFNQLKAANVLIVGETGTGTRRAATSMSNPPSAAAAHLRFICPL